jgi:hypothetical protein
MKTAGSLDNIAERDFEWLKGKGEAGEIPGWESFRLANKYLSII